MLKGRDFTWLDSDTSQRVAIVNETLARQLFGDDEPIGQRVRFGHAGAVSTVVGVVETGKYQSLTEEARAAIFAPMLQVPNTTTVILARATRPDAQLADVLRQAIREADPALPLIGVRPVEDALGYVRLPMQAAAIALGAFGILAATLAATGIHGVVAYAVSRRRRELAIRVALGAPWHGLVQLVVHRTIVLVVIGTLAGMAMAVGLRIVLATVLYMPDTESVWSWMTVIGVMVLTSVVACAWPAWRALSVDPVAALAAE